MRKIENVIEKCNDCKHCIFLQEERGNGFFSAICTFSTEETEMEPFLIDHGSDTCRNYNLIIPDNCPLETYKP